MVKIWDSKQTHLVTPRKMSVHTPTVRSPLIAKLNQECTTGSKDIQMPVRFLNEPSMVCVSQSEHLIYMYECNQYF